jgi:dihydroorotate dehydrogenase
MLPYRLIRPLLFRMSAERAHHVTLAGLRAASAVGLDKLLSPEISDSPVEVMGLRFPNRLGLAAGLDKAGQCIRGFGQMGFGHVEVGTITPRPQAGNPKPRLFRIKEREAIINRMGFNNPGMAAGLDNIAQSRRGFRGVLGINIGKNKDTPNENAIDDYLTCFRKAYTAADYIAVNVSSPNTVGLRDLQDPEAAGNLLKQLKEEQVAMTEETGRRVPFAVKIAPDMESAQIADLGAMFSEIKMDAVIATNTTISRDSVKGLPHCDEAGGLSGAPLTERSTQVIAELRAALDAKIPIIGVGGIVSGADARAKLEAGAALVQIYSGLIYRGPELIKEVLRALP